MLKDYLQGKCIALIGYRTTLGRIILKKILHQSPTLPRIIAI